MEESPRQEEANDFFATHPLCLRSSRPLCPSLASVWRCAADEVRPLTVTLCSALIGRPGRRRGGGAAVSIPVGPVPPVTLELCLCVCVTHLKNAHTQNKHFTCVLIPSHMIACHVALIISLISPSHLYGNVREHVCFSRQICLKGNMGC